MILMSSFLSCIFLVVNPNVFLIVGERESRYTHESRAQCDVDDDDDDDDNGDCMMMSMMHGQD